MSLLPAATVTAGIWTYATYVAAPAPRPVQAVAAPTPVQQVGRIVAVTEDSVTTRAHDGTVTTFVITPNTNKIGVNENGTGSATTQFVPDQLVTVVGKIQNGTTVATALADDSAVGPDGPPMDYALGGA
ncbi:MAG: hypothetical protein U1D00_31785 [Mycobacterium sp.]|nr:hypothetical protein [Mycobacterium sp.]